MKKNYSTEGNQTSHFDQKYSPKNIPSSSLLLSSCMIIGLLRIKSFYSSLRIFNDGLKDNLVSSSRFNLNFCYFNDINKTPFNKSEFLKNFLRKYQKLSLKPEFLFLLRFRREVFWIYPGHVNFIPSRATRAA